MTPAPARDHEHVQGRSLSFTMPDESPCPGLGTWRAFPWSMWLFASLVIFAILLWPLAAILCAATDCMR